MAPGDNFYVLRNLCRAELVDPAGLTLRSWSHTPCHRWEHATPLPDGGIIAVGSDPHDWTEPGPEARTADEARYVVRLDGAGRVVWKRFVRTHHRIEPAPDGNFLALSFERRLLPRYHDSVPVRDDQVLRISPAGEVLSAISLLDAVEAVPGRFDLISVPPMIHGGPPWLDIFHSNAIQQLDDAALAARHSLFARGNLLVTLRHQDRIAILDARGREVLWSWGRGVIEGPHDANLLPNGRILVFDNGLARGWSRALEVDPVTNRIAWEFRADPPSSFFTRAAGGAQRLENGNTLLTESDAGRALEITPRGEVVWEYLTPLRTEEGERAAMTVLRRYPRGFAGDQR